ncbi:glycosyltransferase family 2 protein [Methanobrevibacter sp.]|uniref:glycosyltransferase family 2 protein n=1 Tax=Methanobrevibacter sp. TaxID=66852 RepID=UPI0025D7A9C9|nr:glycosyltransferase family 2 protein [Methanobrevibacter sp.]MBQ6512987.1 glycosyltransferase family 2 protein [Methanobrevibacter sp.]
MSEFKVSIIIPVFNGEKYLSDALDSIVNQSIGVDNLEVIIVDDASTDGTCEIIDRYCDKYANFKAIKLEKNMGAAYGPRNVALGEATSDYIMFLDADDSFTQDACRVLYDEISSSGANIVFGRYFRVYDDFRLKSYSPYGDNLDIKNDMEFNPTFPGAVSFLWSKIFYKMFYGKQSEIRDRVFISDVRQNPEILKILPSIWTRIFKKSIVDKFPELITGEDLNFVLDAYDSGEIVFLNNEFITNYYMRFDTSDLSITKNINFNLVLDSLRAYKLAIIKCQKYGFKGYDKMVNPFLLNYLSLLKKGDFSKDEMKILLSEIKEVDDIYKNKGLLGFLIVKLIKFSSR